MENYHKHGNNKLQAALEATQKKHLRAGVDANDENNEPQVEVVPFRQDDEPHTTPKRDKELHLSQPTNRRITNHKTSATVSVHCIVGGCPSPVAITDLSLKALSITENSSDLLPTNQDVTELNNLSTAFNRLIAEQRRRIQELSELSSNLLHDLKTPLANMRNDAEAALTSETDCTTALQDVCESCDKLLTAIGTNSDIAAIASGLNRSISEDVNVCEQIRTTVEIYQFFADSKHITLSTALPHVDIHIRALKLRIQQLLSNLVDNAVKYTPDGGTVTITAKQEESQCVITISDTGIGISEDILPKIFTRFFRADASRHEPGFGLGLPLVKAIVDFYHGTVVCSSVVGQGTSFTVVLPLTK